MRKSNALLLGVVMCAQCAPALAGSLPAQHPVPPAGSGGWANQHLGNWDPNAPDYGFEFATIGHPGNRTANLSERSKLSMQYWPELGRVDHRYRISTTEVTTDQWEPFFYAILPHWQAIAGPFSFGDVLPEHMTLDFFSETGFRVIAGEERSAVRADWRMAARYCNWLHNGAPDAAHSAAETFSTGAYDIPFDPDAPYASLPLSANEGARYRLPTMDEWIKAAHYDPNRHGDGEEGYWTNHGGQDDALIAGLPWEGGETSAGPNAAFGGNDVDRDGIPVAAYDTTSPWGLYDTSGQESEWTETPGELVFFDGSVLPQNRYVLGPSMVNSFPDGLDEMLLAFPTGDSVGGGYSIRLVTAIPSPTGGGILLLGVVASAASRRRAP